MRISRRFFWPLALIVTLSGCALSGEPPVIATIRPPTATPAPAVADAGVPTAAINLDRGRQIFTSAQGCALCHGVTGQWDGPSAAAFECQPKLRDVANRQDSLQAWFQITSNGNGGPVSCLMPPWRSRLNEQERWDVTAYAYSLRYSQAELQRGAAVWAESCASCHGADGTGGPDKLPNLAAPDKLVRFSDNDLYNTITNGLQNVQNHVFAALSESDRWAVTAYLRVQGWQGAERLIGSAAAGAATPAQTPLPPTAAATVASTVAPTTVLPTPAGTEEAVSPTAIAAAPAPTVTTVTGTIDPNGVKLAAGEKVTLRVLERSTHSGITEVTLLETAVTAEGTFTFSEVPKREGLIYVASATASGVTQFSDPVVIAADTADPIQITFRLRETTADPSTIRVNVGRIFIEFIDNDFALIQSAYRFSNVGDKIFTTGEKSADGRPVSITIDLPPGASNIEIVPDLAAQWRVVGDGSPEPKVQGVVAVAPGEAPVLQYAFRIRHTNILIYAARNRYPIDSLFVNIPQTINARISEPTFAKGEPISLQDGIYDTYVMAAALPANAGLRFTVESTSVNPTSPTNVVFAVVLVVAVLAGAAYVVIRLNRREAHADDEKSEAAAPELVVPDAKQALIATIARLDQAFADGKISKAAYTAERERYKAALSALLQNDSEGKPKS